MEYFTFFFVVLANRKKPFLGKVRNKIFFEKYFSFLRRIEKRFDSCRLQTTTNIVILIIAEQEYV